MKIPCSVPILTLNAKVGLERLLPIIVPRIEDVYIMDGNSTDGTQEYARSLGVRVERQFDTDEPNQRITDFHAMRMRLWSKAERDWLFILDADEYPTPELIDRVAEIVAKNKPMEAHRFCRLAKLPDGRVVKHAFFYPELYIRLFNKKAGLTLAKRAAHERFIVPAGVMEIDHAEALIAPWLPAGVMWKKMMRYISLEAENIQDTWTYLLRWIILFNLRSVIGQLLRALRAWLVALIRRETVLPWRYTFVMIGYRFVSMRSGLKAWMKK